MTTSMVETDTDTAQPSASEDKRVVLDLVIAGLICLAAVGYWLWDARPSDTKPVAEAPAKIVEAQPVTKDPHNDEGFRLYSASNYVGAEAQFRIAISANPRQAIGYCNLGAALIAQRRYDEAVTSLQTAIALDPSLKLAKDNLNWALQEKATNGK